MGTYKLTSRLLNSLIDFNTYNGVLDIDFLVDTDKFDYVEKTLFSYDTYISHMYDNKKYLSLLEKTIVELFPKKLSWYGVDINFKIGKVIQPKYYNFKGDYIEIDVKVSLNHLTSIIDMFADEFNQFLQRYNSYSGFISFLPTGVSEWINADNDYKVATAINFFAERSDFKIIDNFAILDAIEYFDFYSCISDSAYNSYLEEKKDFDELIMQSFRKGMSIGIDNLDYTYIDNKVYISEYISDKLNELKNEGQYEIEF